MTEVRDMESYYGMISQRFGDLFEAGAYYSVHYPDSNDKHGDIFKERGQPEALAWRKDLAVTARFDINENWVLKIEGHYVDGLREVSSSDGNPSDTSFLFAAKMTFSF